MRLIFYGSLRKQFGAEAHMEAATIADAIEGFSRQVDWPKDFPIRVVGFDSEEKLHHFSEEVHLMPAMRGGGGKFGQILLGAALVVTGILLPGSSAFAVPLIVSGGLMIAQGVIGLFLKSPTVKGVDDPEASKYLAVNKNTTTIGTPMNLAYGRIDIAGHWLSLQSDSTNLAYGTFPAI